MLALLLTVLVLTLAPGAGAQTAAHFAYVASTAGGDFVAPVGLATDSSGNVYVADPYGPAVYEIPVGCTSSSCVQPLGGGFGYPNAVAVDSAGIVYVADSVNNAVYEIPLGCVQANCVVKLGGTFNFASPFGVAVYNGNVFVTQGTTGTVFELATTCLLSTCVGSLSVPAPLAPIVATVDGSGNLFVLGSLSGSATEVYELTAASSYTTGSQVGATLTGFASNLAYGLAVDKDENVYFTVSGKAGDGGVYEILANGGYATTKTLIGNINSSSSGSSGPNGVAVSGHRVYFSSGIGPGRVTELATAGADFGAVAVGQTSAAVPLTFAFDAVGSINAPAVLMEGVGGLDFADALTGSCNTNGTLHSYAIGETCTVNVTFAPQAAGQREGAVDLTAVTGLAAFVRRANGGRGLNPSAGAGGTPIASGYVFGIGNAPQAVLIPGTISAVAGYYNSGGLGFVFGEARSGKTRPMAAARAKIDAVRANLKDRPALSPATGQALAFPGGVAADGAGDYFVADTYDCIVWEVDNTGNIALIAGNGTCGYNGDGILAANAEVFWPWAVAVDGAGNLYIADGGNDLIRKVTPGSDGTLATGTISTIAGNTSNQYPYEFCEFAIPNAAGLACPSGVAADRVGNVYFTDTYNSYVGKVDTSGNITTVAGINGTPGTTLPSNGTLAVNAALGAPFGVALDSAGNLYISDDNLNVVMEVAAATQTISTVAGNGTAGYTGDGTLAINAELGTGLGGITLDGAANLYIADFGNYVIRKVDAATGIINTIAGNFYSTNLYGGDGGPATSASLNEPNGVAVDGAGDLYIADFGNSLIREVTASAAGLQFLTPTYVGSIDIPDGAQTVTVSNIGNQALTFQPFTDMLDAVLESPTVADCQNSSTLLSGASCTLGIEFEPASVGVSLTGYVNVVDNALNAAGPNYATQSIGLTGTGTQAPQSITFPTIPTQIVGASFTLSATASSGLPVILVSKTPAVCTVLGTTATMVTRGSCGITAYQAGDSNFFAATEVGHTFWVGGEAQSIAFAAIPATPLAAGSVALAATASSGLAVSYASATPAVCGVSGSTVTLLTGGNCGIVATQAGNSQYAAAPPVGLNFAVTMATQTITFASIATQPVGVSIPLNATASSGLMVSFISMTPSVCTVTGSSAILFAVGSCGIVAKQAGNINFLAAPEVGHTFWVGLGAQTITFPAIAGTPLAAGSVALTATASSGLAVSYASVTPLVCEVSGSTVNLVAGGNCGIVATQAGSRMYAAARPVGRNFAVTLATQTITFPAIGTQVVGANVTLTATASSGLAVSYVSTTPLVCTVSGSNASMVAVGSCGIVATQVGNGYFLAAPEAGHTFWVGPTR
jgi:sugar lactone lactonase YvrE